uniref:G-protein coupled receptors family 1 profile domain-containing protein n=1 Tax=Plectus sambesii TaxID=2011161 RepID=A0A914UXJ7_9BILA
MNDTNEEFLNEFYGPTAQWFSLFLYIMVILILSSNMFLIVIILTSKNLRNKSSNWFLVGFAMSGFLHGVAHVSDGVAIQFGSADNGLLCSIAGSFHFITGANSFGFPLLIAADRYYKITDPQPNTFSLGHTLFTDVCIVPLIFGWFCFVILFNMPLLLNNAFGEDTVGFCGIKKFTEVRIMLMYLCVIVIAFAALPLSYVYYKRLAKWIKQNRRSNNAENRKRTKEIMLMIKLIVIVPLVFNTTSLLLGWGQAFFPEMPMWLRRILISPYYVSNVVDPWLTIILVQPIRRRALQLLRKFKATASVSVQRAPVRISVIKDELFRPTAAAKPR